METENPRIRIAKKIYSPPKDTPRKKKQNKKDLDSQNPEGALDISQQKISEPEPSANPQLVQYIYKLQHDLIETKKKLKYEQIKFTNLITSVSSHFDKDGKNFLESMDCNDKWRFLSKLVLGGNVFQEMEDSGEQESGFEKFFTTHKYLISDKKIEPVAEDENNGDQKPKTKAPKAKASAGVVKINLKDVEGDKPEAQTDKEPAKKSKKKKASSPVEEEKESKKKRIKKNTPAAGEETAANKGVDMSKVIVISPTEKEAGGHEADKVRKAEDAINKYEEMAHMKPGPEAYGGMMQNNMFNEGIKYMMQQAKVDPGSLLNQQIMRGNMGYPMMPNGEPIDQAKLVQELIKQGINDPVLMGMAAPTQELLNYYQRAFQS